MPRVGPYIVNPAYTAAGGPGPAKTPLSPPGYRAATPTQIAAGSAGGPSHAKNNRSNTHVNPEQHHIIFHPPPVVCQLWHGILKSMRSCPVIFILAMAASSGFQTAARATDAFVAPVSGRTQAIAAVETRLAKLQNVAVSFHMDVDFASSPAVLAAMRRAAKLAEENYPGGGPAQPLLGHYLYQCRFSFLAGRSWYRLVAVGPARNLVTWLGAPEVTQSRMPGRAEMLAGSKIGEIFARASPLIDYMPISSALGLRPASLRHWLWIKSRQLTQMTYARISNDRFSLTQKTRFGGFTKYYRWVLRTKPALEIVSLNVYHHPGIRPPYMRGTFSRFHLVGGLALPGRIKDTFFGISRLSVPTMTELLTHIRYTVGSPSNTPFRYYIVWPKGCTVIDERTGSRFQIKSPTVLSDKEIMSRLKKRDKTGPHRPQ